MFLFPFLYYHNSDRDIVREYFIFNKKVNVSFNDYFIQTFNMFDIFEDDIIPKKLVSLHSFFSHIKNITSEEDRFEVRSAKIIRYSIDINSKEELESWFDKLFSYKEPNRIKNFKDFLD
jgi:hypothetical protein